ncbi:MAG: YraN family protein [Gemmatimonadales bacterium]|nr:MAG: YraN family protein [Gemmatimonadales bacterium]
MDHPREGQAERSETGRTTTAVGRAGESLAARHLGREGWHVLSRNWRDGPRELDLVVRRRETLAFVEVKSRGPEALAHPHAAIGWRKRREVERAAAAWLVENAASCRGVTTFRFDSVAILRKPGGEVGVDHLEDAWRRGE